MSNTNILLVLLAVVVTALAGTMTALVVHAHVYLLHGQLVVHACWDLEPEQWWGTVLMGAVTLGMWAAALLCPKAVVED